jgi:hypothetical protein
VGPLQRQMYQDKEGVVDVEGVDVMEEEVMADEDEEEETAETEVDWLGQAEQATTTSSKGTPMA